MEQKCDIRRPKQWIVTMQVACAPGESLESACWRWRPIMGDRVAIQASGDEGVVLRLYVDGWHMQGDAEAAAKEARKRYRLSVGEDDRLEVLETLQAVGHDGTV